MSRASAKLGEIELLGEVGWKFTTGVEPYQRAFTIHRNDLEKALEMRRAPFGVELNVTGEVESDNWFAHRLYVLRAVPTQHPEMAAVWVSDVRWTWRYKWIMARFNEKRRTGNRRLIPSGDDLVLSEVQFTTDEIAYAPYSLQPPTYSRKWDARDVIRYVVGKVTDYGSGPTYSDDQSLYATAINIEDLTIDDDGATAVARVLSFLPGSSLRVDEYGNTQIYNSTDGSEARMLQSLGADYAVNATLPELVSMSAERPEEIHVHFTCEHEVRFDFVEGATRDRKGRWLRNVMPTPVNILLDGQLITAGTYVEITDALLLAFQVQFPPITILGKVLPPLTLDILRQIWCNGQYNRYMEAFAAQNASADPVWANILNALKENYRQTFQVNREWADRIVMFLPRRVALLDPVNNVWGKPSVFSNYAVIPTYRRVGRNASEPTFLAYNREAFPTPSAAPGVYLDTIQNLQAIAETKMLDDKLGIFKIVYLNRPGQDLEAIPSSIEGYDRATRAPTELPGANVAHPLRVLSDCRLKSSHALSIVITVVTGAPNNLGQTYDYSVTLDDARQVLPEPIRKLLPDAHGPVLHIHTGVTTARFCWDQRFAENIERTIMEDGEDQKDFRIMVNNRQIKDIAVAMAASFYSKMVDHVEGQPTYRVNAFARPTGRITEVEHSLDPDTGANVTTVTIPPPRKGIDFWGLLPDFLRRIIKGQLPPS